MSAFVNELRARRDTIRVGSAGSAGGGAITVRAQVPEVWDTVRLSAASTEPVLAVKRAALGALLPDDSLADEFVVKLNGFEVLDENASLADAGVKDGSTLLITYRRKRPIK